MNSFYTKAELDELGFDHVGVNVMISRNACIYSASKIRIGNNVRIDDFCILSGKIVIGNHVHIAVGVSLFAGETGIEINDFVGLSSRTVVYAESDDYSGDYLTNPTVPVKYKHIISGKISFGKHVLLGSGCTVLPGVSVGEGASVGAMSLIAKDVAPWNISVGIPCKVIKKRSDKLLELEQELLIEETSDENA